MNKAYFCRNVFLIDWRHKSLKNTIDLFLFYGKHFYGFSESVLGIFKNTYFEEHLRTAASTLTLESDCLELCFCTVAFKTIQTR